MKSNTKNKDNISGYSISLKKLISGVNKVTDIIKPTYGAAGGNVAIEDSRPPFHAIRNDGKLIVDSIWLADPIEMVGKNILSEVCEKQEKEAGDGRKTTCILTAAILNEGLKYKDKIQPLELKRQLDACLPIIIESIDGQKKEITVEQVGTIAKIASESEEIGNIIGEIYPKIGREGIIEIDTSGLADTFYEISEGYRIRGGWLGGYWQTEEGKCIVKKPKILTSKDKITNISQLEPLYKELAAEGINELVIYCEDIDIPIASRLALTTAKGGFKTLIIKAPIMWKDWIYEDFAKMTGATPVDSLTGHTFKLLKTSDLGTCEKLVCTENETRVIGIKDISEYIAKLKEDGLKDNQQLLRASWLNTKVAVLKVGANSESELSWKLKKTKDACHAAYYALQDGAVEGAGLSFKNAALKLSKAYKVHDYRGIVATWLGKCLLSPSLCLIENGTTDVEGVQDPAIVVKSAITNAISIAGIILTTKGVITIPQQIKDEIKEMQARMTPR